MNAPTIKLFVGSDSIYEGHAKNIKSYEQSSYKGLNDDTIILMCHDDVQILSDDDTLIKYLELCNKPGVGFVGIAGSTVLGSHDTNHGWWNARKYAKTRGFLFQGEDEVSMTPNPFGPCGQVVVLDGCFIACSYKTLKAVGFTKPSYLSSDWDFYDIHLTFAAHLQGLNNYAVPIMIRHESPGNMRDPWYTSRDEFFRHHRSNLPCSIPFEKTHGLPN
jgi:hypothetical protein